MSKQLLLGILVVLVITNIATLLFWNMGDKVVLDGSDKEISRTKPVAIVGGKEISYDAWMESLRDLHGKSQLKKMIDRELVKQLAAKKDIVIDEKLIEREISFLTTMQGVMTKEETKKKEKKWRKDIIYRYQLAALLTEDVTIPEEKLRKYYNEYHNQYDFSQSIQISHIVLDDFQTAKKVKKELDSGASFQLLATEYSTDEETRNEGGYLGFYTESSQFLPDGYFEKAMEMDARSYSEPFKSGAGISIIYVHRKLPAIKFTYNEIKPYMEDELALGKLDQSLIADPLWEKADIEWIYE